LRICPGRVDVEVRLRERAIWGVDAEVEVDGEASLEVAPRPNAVLLGAKEWPAALEAVGSSVNVRSGLPAPEGSDLSNASAWEGVAIPPNTDLAVAALPPGHGGTSPRWFFYSPILKIAGPLETDFDAERPVWRAT